VGRVAAIHNRRHVEYQGESTGFFGFYECQRDDEASAALLDAAAAWLRERGLETMRGPVSFSTNEQAGSTNEQAGLLVEGFEDPPAVMMAYNPPYYAEQLEVYGLEPAKTLVAYFLHAAAPPEYLVRARWSRTSCTLPLRPNTSCGRLASSRDAPACGSGRSASETSTGT
jgi:hypothetical protein